MGYGMIPLQRVRMAIQLNELSSKRFFIPTYPGAYKGHVSGEPTHISRMNRMRISLLPGRRCRSLTLYDLYLSDSLPDFTVAGEPMVDPLGQYNRMDWEGKTRSVEELVRNLSTERVAHLAQTRPHRGFLGHRETFEFGAQCCSLLP